MELFVLFFRITPAPLTSINGGLSDGKSSCTIYLQAPITTQYDANRNNRSTLYGPSLNQSTVAMDTKNCDSLNSSAPPPFRSISKTDVINLDLSTKKYSPILLMSSDMHSDNGTYLQDHRAGKPCLSGYPPGEYPHLKSLNQARAHLWRQS